MKWLLLARPDGARLFELSDEEFARLEHVLEIEEPRARGSWVRRFLGERVPTTIYPPGSTGPPDDVQIDRALGGEPLHPEVGPPAAALAPRVSAAGRRQGPSRTTSAYRRTGGRRPRPGPARPRDGTDGRRAKGRAGHQERPDPSIEAGPFL